MAEKKTPLYDRHIELGGNMVNFGGFLLPTQYTGIKQEHQAVRSKAGIFDVSHMGEFIVSGQDAESFLQKMTVNDVASLSVGQAQYSAMCFENGGIVDDLLVYKKEDDFMLVVNAARKKTDWNWLLRFVNDFEVELTDRSEEIGLLALQGPKSQEIVESMTDLNLDQIRYYHFAEGKVGGIATTGEDGFEFYVESGSAVTLWENLLDSGVAQGLKPAGLGSRDSLRLEVGFALYGNDLDDLHTPLESGLNWLVKWDAGDFVGREALLRQKSEGLPEKLITIILDQKGFPRPGYVIKCDGLEVGKVTSGTVSPSLGEGIAMGYVPGGLAESPAGFGVQIRDRTIPSTPIKPPFYKGGSVRR
ncbi:MAG TPA: glycine cleavage system aminomethyltransferase GcvT [Gemmatimonadetes bacterium]|nr:glycine cleavage system aminomethyltransferase GcvT [Gemmatimonadota bacterium]